ncbi:MAG: hypothetical protein AAFP19_19570 [Bacteroidota bacterium]
MSPTYFYSDLEVLKALFGPENALCLIYNPKQRLILNLPEEVVAFQERTVLIQYLAKRREDHFILFNMAGEDLLDLYGQSQILTIVRFGHQKEEKRQPALYYTINNPDGSIRWIVPSDNKYPGFLNLYNANTLKAKAFRHLAKQLFQRGVPHLLASGSFVFFHKGPHPIERYLADFSNQEYTIFTGTIGLNRKAIIELGQNGQSTHFIKWPVSPKSLSLVQQEEQAIRRTSQLGIRGLSLPRIRTLGKALLQSNVKNGQQYSADHLSAVHMQLLLRAYEHSEETSPLTALASYREIGERLTRLKNGHLLLNGMNPEYTGQLIDRMDQHYQAIDADTLVSFAWAHGDFTPWNMYLSKEGVALYDLELSRMDMPLLYDAFHFIFQSAILIHRYGYSRIRSQLRALANMPEVQKMVDQYQLDIDLHLRFYLLYNISYYLEQYIQQIRLHAQVHWLVDVWLETLRSIELQSTSTEKRSINY